MCNDGSCVRNQKVCDQTKVSFFFITASNFVIGDNGTKESKEILKTFIELVKLSEEEYEEQKKLYG